MSEQQGQQLARFRTAKEQEIAALRDLAARMLLPTPYAKPRPSFQGALQKDGQFPAIIAEYKRASPSKGLICESVSVEEAVLAYAQNGAKALSILTEERYFAGDLGFLARARACLESNHLEHIPLLRKDFLFDELQVLATAATPASAFLLIVRQTPDVQELRHMRELGAKYGLEAVVEVFDAEDLERARQSGARLIQVNARDLDTLTVDRQACLELIQAFQPRAQETWIAASGMEQGEHLRLAANVGYTAALVGTALMKDGTPGKALAQLCAAKNCG